MKVSLVYVNRERCANQGVGYVASSILDAGHSLDFIDLAYTSEGEAMGRVLQYEAEVLLLSCSTLFSRRAGAFAAEHKRLRPDVPTLLGGVHSTVVGGAALEECPSLDYICVGEGEEFVVEFLEALLGYSTELDRLANLGYRDSTGRIMVNPVRPPIDLSLLPRFRHELWEPFSVVQPHPFPGMTYVYATRGCPYSCTYCGNSSYRALYRGQRYVRTRPIDSVIGELLYLKKHYPAQFLFFGDEMVVFDERYVSELFPRIRDEVQLPYGCMARIESITPSLVELLRVTGCQYVGMGVECGDEQFRKDFLNRHMTNEQIIQAFASLRLNIPGIKLCSYNMRGYPVAYDDELTRKTGELNGIIKADIVQMAYFFPLPGTRLYEYCIERDLIDMAKVDLSDDVFTRSVLKSIPAGVQN